MDAQSDELTGLSRRSYFLLDAERLLAEAKATSAVLGLVYVDIDKMKPVNDTSGFPSGDRLLVRLAQVVQSYLPDGAIAARYSGDEFLLAIPATTEAVVLALAESMRRDAKEVVIKGGDSPSDTSRWDAGPVSLTLGLSFYPRHGDDLQALMAAADEANQQGKRNGGDCVVLA